MAESHFEADHETLAAREIELFVEREPLGFSIPGSDGEASEGLPHSFLIGPDHDTRTHVTLKASLAQFVAFIRGRRQGLGFGAIPDDLQGQVPAGVTSLVVAFEVSRDSVNEYLWSAVFRVAIPRIPASTADELRMDAFHHVRLKVLSHLKNARDPEHYLLRAIRNFRKTEIVRGKRRAVAKVGDIDRITGL